MYGLPEGTDLSFLNNLELIQVCFGSCQVIMRFEKDTSILLECDYAGNGQRNHALGLIELLGKYTLNAVQGLNGQITLKFAEGSDVVFQDDDPNYECYIITAPGQHIIV